jgi:hypothetical protein
MAEKEYIEKDIAIKKVGAVSWAASRINNIPAADVVELKHATWLIHGFSCPCSNCGYDLGYAGTPLEPTLAFFKYCPNCGAKMDGGVNDAAD